MRSRHLTIHYPAPVIAIVAVAVVAVLFLALTVALQVRTRRRHALPTRPVHVARRAHLHLPLPLLALLIGFNTVAAGAAATYAIGGASFNPHARRVAPPAALVREGAALTGAHRAAGQGGGAVAVNMRADMPPVPNQRDWYDCGGVTLALNLGAILRQRGEHPPDFSYAYVYRNATGAGTSPPGPYTNMPQEVDAENSYGIVAYSTLPQPSDAQGPGRVYYFRITLRTLFYDYAGVAGLDAIKAVLWHKQHVAILSQWNQGMSQGLYGQSYIDNSGATLAYHFMAVYGFDDSGLYTMQSYGTRYGNGGVFTFLAASAARTIEAAYTYDIGPDPYFGAHSTPRPTAPPPTATVAPRPTVRPTATPRPTVRPTPTRVVVAPVLPLYTLTATHALRAGPRAGSALGRVLRRGWQIRATGRQTPGWISGRTLDGKATGWIARAWVVRAH